jgi:hypothetical protein
MFPHFPAILLATILISSSCNALSSSSFLKLFQAYIQDQSAPAHHKAEAKTTPRPSRGKFLALFRRYVRDASAHLKTTTMASDDEGGSTTTNDGGVAGNLLDGIHPAMIGGPQTEAWSGVVWNRDGIILCSILLTAAVALVLCCCVCLCACSGRGGRD